MQGVKVLVRFHESSRVEIGTMIWLTDRLGIDHKAAPGLDFCRDPFRKLNWAQGTKKTGTGHI
jgi:hypothetical protein